MTTSILDEFISGQIWLREYPIRYFGARVNARMTLIRLAGGDVLLHSPCPADEAVVEAVRRIGPVKGLIVPGNFHHMHVSSWQQVFPEARTYACPGVGRRNPELRYDELLGDEAPALWAEELSQVFIQGSDYIREVAFFHRASKTVVLVDVFENIGDRTPGTNWILRLWFVPLGMWNRPAPAPEYRFTWSDRALARACFERVLAWDIERIVLAHGDLVTENAREVLERAWKRSGC